MFIKKGLIKRSALSNVYLSKYYNLSIYPDSCISERERETGRQTGRQRETDRPRE